MRLAKDTRQTLDLAIEALMLRATNYLSIKITAGTSTGHLRG
jgi:hypothetical protein